MKIKFLPSISLLAISTAFLATIAISCVQLKTITNDNIELEKIISNLQNSKFLANNKIIDKQVSNVIQEINQIEIKDRDAFNSYIDTNNNFLAIIGNAEIKNFIASKVNKNANEIYVELTIAYPNVVEEKKARVTITSLKNDNFLKGVVKNWYNELPEQQEVSEIFKNKNEFFLNQELDGKIKDETTLKTLLSTIPIVPDSFNINFEFFGKFDYINGKVKILIALKNSLNQITDVNGESNSNFTNFNGKEITITGFEKNDFSNDAKLWYQSLKHYGPFANAYTFDTIYKDKYSDDVFAMISKDPQELFITLSKDLPPTPDGFSASLNFDDTSFDFKFAGIWIPKVTLFKTNDLRIKYNQDGNYEPNFNGQYISISGLKFYSRQMFTDFWFSRLNQSYEVLDELKNKTNEELVELLKNKSDLKDILKNPSLPRGGITGLSPKFTIDAKQGSFGQVSTTGEGIIYLFLEERVSASGITTIKRWIPSDSNIFEKTIGKIVKVNGFTIK